MDTHLDEMDGGFELLEDRTRRIDVGPRGRRLGVSVPGALLGTFLVAALAFGAAGAPGPFDGSVTGGQSVEQPSGETADGEPQDETADPDGDEPADETAEPEEGVETDGDEPDVDQPADEPGADEPADEAEEPADPSLLEIGVGLNDGRVVIEWSACEADGFVAYKVVRSTDGTVTYPKAANDTLAGVVENAGTTRFVDKTAPAGKRLWYRVFALATSDGSARIACASDVGSVVTPDEPDPTPKPEPDPDPTPKPKPDEPDPTPKPEIGSLGLKVVIDEGHPWLDWTSCEVDGFDGYKVVRSKDSAVRFPTGDNDTLVAWIGVGGETAFFDKEAPEGRKLWYRVFCVDKTESGYVVRAASAARAVETPEAETEPDPEPLPEPCAMGFEAEMTGTGVALHWQACGGELFAYYKVVRSATSNPSYLPGTEGSQVIAVIENPSETSWIDGIDDAGRWYYRIQAIGYHDGSKVLLGQTAVKSVVVE